MVAVASLDPCVQPGLWEHGDSMVVASLDLCVYQGYGSTDELVAVAALESPLLHRLQLRMLHSLIQLLSVIPQCGSLSHFTSSQSYFRVQ